MNAEIVRTLVAGLLCAAALLLLGFAPLLLPSEDVWAASTESSVVMPVGQSQPADSLRPIGAKQPSFGGAEYLKRMFGL